MLDGERIARQSRAYPVSFLESTRDRTPEHTRVQFPLKLTAPARIRIAAGSPPPGDFVFVKLAFFEAGPSKALLATVRLNGESISPPVWNHPGARRDDLRDVPWTDECAWIRPPTPIRLRKGVNRVEITLPKTDDGWYWSASFVPVTGTREHPREIEGVTWR